MHTFLKLCLLWPDDGLHKPKLVTFANEFNKRLLHLTAIHILVSVCQHNGEKSIKILLALVRTLLFSILHLFMSYV